MSRLEDELAQRRLIRTIATEVAYEILQEHLDEYEHTPKKTDHTETKLHKDKKL